MHLDSYEKDGTSIIVKVPVGTDKSHHEDQRIDGLFMEAIRRLNEKEETRAFNGTADRCYSESGGKFYHEYQLYVSYPFLKKSTGKTSNHELQNEAFKRLNEAIKDIQGYSFPST